VRNGIVNLRDELGAVAGLFEDQIAKLDQPQAT